MQELHIPNSVGFCKKCFRSRRHGSAYCGLCQDEPERMKVYHDSQYKFPMLKKAVQTFNLSDEQLKHICFTYGNVLYSQEELSYGLIAHELTHVFQQLRKGEKEWWKEYLKDPKFRLGQEVEAYQQQYRIYQLNDTTRAEMELTRMAGDLSSPMYGRIIDFDEAKRMIKQELGG